MNRFADLHASATDNLRLTPYLAFRASLDRLEDQGFIGRPFVVKQPGMSNPDPDFASPTAVANNLRRAKDVNNERTTTGHAALRWQPTPTLDATLNYYYQRQETDVRSTPT